MATLSECRRVIQGYIEIALNGEYSHVVLLKSKYNDIYEDFVEFGESAEKKAKSLADYGKDHFITIDLGEDIEPQIDEAEKLFRKNYIRY